MISSRWLVSSGRPLSQLGESSRFQSRPSGFSHLTSMVPGRWNSGVAQRTCRRGWRRRGARPVGVDPTPGQLRIARQFQDEYALWFPLVRAAAERVPLRDAAFDVIISEYGAAIWADPYRWIPEAARLLRPGGELVFLGNSTLLMLCVPDEDGVPATERLLRPQFEMHRFEWPDDLSVEFHLGHGDWIRLLRANQFVIDDLVELRPPADAHSGYPFVTVDWARRWPCEEAWRARRR